MAARTAVVAGTATAVSGGVARRQNARADAKAEEQYQQQAEQQQQYAAPPPAAEPAAPEESTDDLIAQLKKLGDLKDAGVLDEAEFQTAKAKLLAQM
jgi:type II secretory pathway pseudopilin PulG